MTYYDNLLESLKRSHELLEMEDSEMTYMEDLIISIVKDYGKTSDNKVYAINIISRTPIGFIGPGSTTIYEYPFRITCYDNYLSIHAGVKVYGWENLSGLTESMKLLSEIKYEVFEKLTLEYLLNKYSNKEIKSYYAEYWKARMGSDDYDLTETLKSLRRMKQSKKNSLRFHLKYDEDPENKNSVYSIVSWYEKSPDGFTQGISSDWSSGFSTPIVIDERFGRKRFDELWVLSELIWEMTYYGPTPRAIDQVFYKYLKK